MKHVGESATHIWGDAYDARPMSCETWCASYGYADCTCELEDRQARWDQNNRSPGASELPRAVARFKK